MHWEPDVGFDPGSPGSRPGPKAGAKPLRHPGIPSLGFLKLKCVPQATCYMPSDQDKRKTFYNADGDTKSDRVLTKAKGRKEKASVKCRVCNMYTPAILLIRNVCLVPLTVYRVLVPNLI